ncbi:hypothetical protein E2L08_14735 [Palleronia sediminis]|uniref:Lipoprotein n=1 Tax=Palleronia sediminis TaxID=2547833 RepID=A0A4R5ZXR4_9RHOB|nr:hypothetical protein [Palleronia sediminis]TDL75970.1 hypothetical protein E2L08_14735 [Palleronia sediminis]
MIRQIALIALLPLVAGCAAAPRAGTQAATAPPAPVAVTLYRDTVTARMPGGALCTAVREAGGGAWEGRFAGCPQTWPVAVLRPSPRPRVALGPVAADPWVTLGPDPAAPLLYGPTG